MAKEEKVQSTAPSGSSSGGSSGGSSAKIEGSVSKSGGSTKSSGSSSGSSKVSKAGSNARAAIQAGRAGALANKQRQTGQTQASRYLAARVNAAGNKNDKVYRGAENSPTTGARGYGASGSMQGLQEGRDSQRTPAERDQSVDDSYLQASIMELARGAGGKEVVGDGTAFGYANELIKKWNAGEDVVPVVKNGEVKWERGVDRTGSRVFYDFDAEGNRIKTTDKKLADANDTAMWADVDAWLNYANSDSQTKADNIKQSARIAEYMRAIENGLMDNYDVTKNSGETLSLYDYLGELFDLRDQLDEVADQNEAATALNYFTDQYNDVLTRMKNGTGVDFEKMGDDINSLQSYVNRFSKNELLSPLFTDINDQYYRLYNREYVKNLEGQNEQLLANFQQAQNDARVASDSANWLDSADVVVSDADRQLAKEKKAEADAATKEAYDAQQAVQAHIDQLNKEYRERYMTPEVEAATNRLSIPQLGKAYSKEDIENYLKAGNTRVSFTGSFKDIAEQMRREDQELVDNWNRGLDLNTQYYNWQDRLGGIGKSFGARTLGSVANIAAWGVNATTYANDEVRQAQQVYDAASRDWLTNPTPENHRAMRDAEVALTKAQNRVEGGATERTTPALKIEQFADRMDATAQEELAKVKEGLSKGGQVMVDLGSNALDMGFDAMTGLPIYSMFVRSMGSGIGEARRAGATSEQQLAYGAAQGGVEVLTEKLTDGLGRLYGKGVATDIVEKAISRFTSSKAGANFMRVLFGTGGEGTEELLSGLAAPYLNWIIDEDARQNKTVEYNASELLYDYLIGGAMSILMLPVEVKTGSYAEKNAKIAQNDAAIIEKAENAEATGQPLTKPELRDLKAAQARQENAAIAGGLQVNNNGSISPVSARGVTKGKNRHDTATSVLAEGFENEGYVNSTNEDEDYNIATTGMENRPLSAEEADQQSHDQMLEEEGKRQVEVAAEEEARKAQEAKNAENAKLDEESKRREQEIEGARQAAKAYQDEQDAQLRAAQEADRLAASARAAREFQAEQDYIREAQQARQAAEEAGRKAEEQIAFAESKSRTLEGQEQSVASAPVNQEQQNRSLAGSQEAALEAQNQNVASAPANQERQNQAIAASQVQTIEGQDTNPVQAPKKADVATATETPQGETQASTQAQTPDNTQEAVKLEGNAQGEGSRAVATAEQGKASIESGETNNKTVAEVIPMVDKHVSTQDAVSTVAENVFVKSFSEKTPLSERVTKWFKNRFPSGNVKASSVGGSVVIAKRGIKNDVAHGLSDAKVATFAAIPDILDKGMVVSQSDGSAKDKSVTVAGKVMLYGEPVNVYCVVKKNSGNNRFYLHEVSDGNGTVYYQIDNSNKKNATPALQDSTGTNPASADVTSKASIAQDAQSGKTTSTNAAGNDIITDDIRQKLDPFPKDISKEEALKYAEAATADWPVYIETNKGSFEYDGNQLYVTDEDGVASNPRKMSHEEFSENLVKWADSEAYNYVVFENSPIKTKGETANANNQGTADDFDIGAEGANRRTTATIRSLSQRSREVSLQYAEKETGEITDSELRDAYFDAVGRRLADQGSKFIPKEEHTSFMQSIKKIVKSIGIDHAFFWWSSNNSPVTLGVYTPEVNAFDLVFKNNDSKSAKLTMKHELTHGVIDKFQLSAFEDYEKLFKDSFATIENAEKAKKQFEYSYNLVKRHYAYGIAEQLRAKYRTEEQWDALSISEQEATITALPQDALENLDRKIHEEFICEAIAGRTDWFFLAPDLMTEWQSNIRNYFAEKGYFSTDLHDKIDALEIEFEQGDDKVSPNRLEELSKEPYLEGDATSKVTDAASEISVPPVDSTPHTPGVKSITQSAAERQMATKGEGATTDAAMGEATYISRTNAARSETADHLTDTQEKADAQAQRLLEDGYTWTDDDVVIAQKLMFDMIKSIRDYQMHRANKMNTAAFRTLTEQYNKLMTKHQQMLSEAGQKLQANYMFSDGDKIIMKAAQTFLGFTKDGRFAGAAPNAKNAKIYAGIEEAVKRIGTAIEARDAQGLAKICKDISNIRNVKKMFGPLGKFADEMETRVLDKVSKGENAAANLEKLAYGNLNAVCDDVQPYKALNAAKTIRVMNMLSNTATIVNNLANNFAQGAVSRSMVNQAFNQLAAKPFEALTGQKVLSTTQRGKTAQKAVHNAKVEALEAATLMQMYGISDNNGRLELNDRGMFNPNINAFEQTMSLYKFLTGMGVEATDQMQAAGFLKEMELGIDEDIKAGKIAPHTREQRMQEARHEVNRLLYKDDNATTALVQHFRDFLNKFSVGNEKTGKIGLGDITMAFAKIPANVVKARLAMTPEGALLQLFQYAKGVNKAKRMHSEVLANNIAQKYSPEMEKYRNTLNALYEAEPSQERTKAIEAVKSKISAINNQMWAEAREQCRGSVFRNLETIRNNYNENMPYDEAVERAGYTNAKEMSQFEAAQLSRKIGRAATSAGMMALGSVLRALGGLRDFDQEPDDELRKMNKDKGYQGLMFNPYAMFRPGHEWKDGDLVLDGEFLEVVAMPLTIGATAAEAAATAQDAKTWAWLKSMAGNGIAKTFEAVGDIPGMADAINMYESMTSAYTTDYDEKVSRLGAGLLNYAANTVPSFFMPNSVSQAAAGLDNTVRDVYTTDSPWEQAKNIFMNKFPVLRNKIPASVDVWGNERNYGEGLWGAVNKMLLPGDVRVYRKNKYETEIERLVKEGYANATPKTTVNSSFEIGDEKYTMTAQEKRDFKLGRNQQQRQLYEAFMDSDYYDQLNDAERMKVFKALKTSAERDAKQTMLNDRQVNVQVTRDRWETELTDINDQIQFLAAKQMANDVLDRDVEDMDYKAVDNYLTGAYKKLNETQRELLDSTYSRLDNMYEAKSKYGIGSEMWQKGYDIYKDYMSDEGKARVQGGYKDWEGSQMYTDIAKATGASEKQMDFFEDNFVLYNNNAVIPEKYNEFVDAGWSRDSAQALVKSIADLTPTNGRKTVSYKQRLTSIATTPNLTEAQRWEAFFEYCPSSYTGVIRTMSRYKSNGTSYEKALKAARKWDK